jgi:excisionase family DNA binding protein
VPKTTGEHWMSTADACARLGIGLRALYRIIDIGELPAYKFGRVIRLRTADVEAYLDAKEDGSGG